MRSLGSLINARASSPPTGALINAQGIYLGIYSMYHITPPQLHPHMQTCHGCYINGAWLVAGRLTVALA